MMLTYTDAVRLFRKFAKQRERVLSAKCSNAGREAERQARRLEVARFLKKVERMEI